MDNLTARTRDAATAIQTLYAAIREAKEQGYSYSELTESTQLSRGTLQEIIAGRNPRVSIL